MLPLELSLEPRFSHGSKAFAVQEGYAGLVKGGPEYIKENEMARRQRFFRRGYQYWQLPEHGV